MNHILTLPGHGKIHAETEGTGPVIVFVHADFVDGRLWDAVRPHLAAQYKTVIYDKLGYGRSDPAQGPVNRRQELAAVVDALGLESFHLVGCSNGGQQALDFTLENQDRVKSLTLVNSSPSGWKFQGDPPPLLLEMIGAMQTGDGVRASELQVQIWFDGPQRDKTQFNPALWEARRMASLMNRICVERGTFFLADYPGILPLVPALDRLTEVRVPTLVIDGRWDWEENHRASRFMAEGIPGAKIIEMDGGHAVPLEDPEGFAHLWEEYCGKKVKLTY